MRELQNILIAEDHPIDVFLLQRAFLKAGISAHLHFVRDGQEAIDYLRGEGEFHDRKAHPFPCLLLLDLKMPRLNGFDVLVWVRHQPGLKRLPIVVLTSSELHEDINRAYDLGASSFVVKPPGLEGQSDFAQRLERYWLELNRSPDCTTIE